MSYANNRTMFLTRGSSIECVSLTIDWPKPPEMELKYVGGGRWIQLWSNYYHGTHQSEQLRRTTIG